MLKIKNLIEKEMTRREFLVILGSTVAGLGGISAFLGLLTPQDRTTHQQAPGYGEFYYGP